jgi:trehalose 6-phosphate phosphatase
VKNILAKRELSRLEQFVTPETLIAFNFDGTLAPLSRDPRVAQLRKSTHRLIMQLASHYPTAVISGRPRADVLARLNGAPVRAVIGNFGLEPSPDAPRYHVLVKKWLPRLREVLQDQQGVEIENKLYSISIHYRRARSKTAARGLISNAIEQQLGTQARMVQGKLVLNVLPAEAPNKGTALLGVRHALHLDHTLFVGDDITDEDVFAIDKPQSLLGIRIGRTGHSKASHYLSTQADIDKLLKRLVAFAGAGAALPKAAPANDVDSGSGRAVAGSKRLHG